MHPTLVAMTLAFFCASPSALRGPSHPASHQAPSQDPVAWVSSDAVNGLSSVGRDVPATARTSAGSAAIETSAFVRILESHPLDALAAHFPGPRWQAIASNLPSGGDRSGAWHALAALVAVVLDGRANKRRAARFTSCGNAWARFAAQEKTSRSA